jgi:hypothetical protein
MSHRISSRMHRRPPTEQPMMIPRVDDDREEEGDDVDALVAGVCCWF